MKRPSKNDIEILYFNNKLSHNSIAKYYKCNRSTVIRWFQFYNIKSRKGSQFLDLTNRQFNSLLVIKRAPNAKNGDTQWYCNCQCGKSVIARSSDLQRNNHNSCRSCASSKERPIQKKRCKYPLIQKTLWNKYKASAARRNIQFDISIEYGHQLLQAQDYKCALTGRLLIIPIKATKQNRPDCTASIDRIDSSKGYIQGNIQWVHKHVNIMKQSLSQEEFINICKEVCDNNGYNI